MESLRQQRGYHADQGAVWNEVAESLEEAGVNSGTSNYMEAQERVAHQIEDYVEAIRAVPNQIGGIFIGSDGVIGAELFSGNLFSRNLPKVVRSFAWEILSSPDLQTVQIEEVVRWWDTVVESSTSRRASPGAGFDIRISADGLIGSGLRYKRRLIHLSVFPIANPDTERPTLRTSSNRQSATQRKRTIVR